MVYFLHVLVELKPRLPVGLLLTSKRNIVNVRPKPRLERALAFVETGQIVFHLKENPCKIGKPPY